MRVWAYGCARGVLLLRRRGVKTPRAAQKNNTPTKRLLLLLLLPRQPARTHPHARPTKNNNNPKTQKFVALYEAAIEDSERAAVPARRAANIIQHLTYEVYLYVSRGLFERHKLLFALMLALKVGVCVCVCVCVRVCERERERESVSVRARA